MNENEIARMLLKYLLAHPDAADTLEGICVWWIDQKDVRVRRRDVEDILRLLVSRGFLVEKKSTGQKEAMYSLNKEKIPDIKTLLRVP